MTDSYLYGESRSAAENDEPLTDENLRILKRDWVAYAFTIDFPYKWIVDQRFADALVAEVSSIFGLQSTIKSIATNMTFAQYQSRYNEHRLDLAALGNEEEIKALKMARPARGYPPFTAPHWTEQTTIHICFPEQVCERHTRIDILVHTGKCRATAHCPSTSEEWVEKFEKAKQNALYSPSLTSTTPSELPEENGFTLPPIPFLFIGIVAIVFNFIYHRFIKANETDGMTDDLVCEQDELEMRDIAI